MIIRPYGDLPATYAPDIGEVVLARRTASDPFVRAVVLHVRRLRDGDLKVKVQWLDALPAAGVKRPTPIAPGDVGFVIDPRSPGRPPLVQQVGQD